jgi:hypothetical protein
VKILNKIMANRFQQHIRPSWLHPRVAGMFQHMQITLTEAKTKPLDNLNICIKSLW